MVEWATEIKVRAERRAGQLLRETAERGERATRATGVEKGANKHLSLDTTSVPTLSDLGISRDQSGCHQHRKAFTPSEAVAMANLIKGQVRAEAAERRRNGGGLGGKGGRGKQASVPQDGSLETPPLAKMDEGNFEIADRRHPPDSAH